MRKIGLVSGGGELPVALAEQCRKAGRPFYVIRILGSAGPDLAGYPGEECSIAALGKMFASLRREGCVAVCFSGRVARPDFSTLKPDWRGMMALPGAIAAARAGDDALLRFMAGEFEKEGFAMEGAHEVAAGLTLPAGALGAVAPKDIHASDIALAARVAREIGRLDIGQGAVVCDGLVLAVEAQEGTDAMLERCAALPGAIRGSVEARRGVLVKQPKPIQDHRLDMPTIGVRTVEGAARAGLAGIVGQAGATLVMDREGVISAADRLGLFVVGLESPS